MSTKGVNATNFSLSKKACPVQGETYTDLSANKVLKKVGNGARRADAYTLEKVAKKG